MVKRLARLEVVAWDETIAVSWTVTNQGIADATADWLDALFVSTDDQWDAGDIQLAEETIADQTPLETGASYTVNLDLTIPVIGTGPQYLLFVTNRDNNQAESDGANNILSTPLEVTAPDLVVDSTVAPGSAQFGQTIDVS